MQVLVVEDDQFFAQQIQELVQDRGAGVVLARSAEEAISGAAQECECAIVDVMLPNDPAQSGITNEESRGGFLTGVCVARRLRSQNPKIRIVLLTSTVGPGEAETWANNNGVILLGKDEGRNRLLRTLEQIGVITSDETPLAFIVHGHDEASLMHLKDYLQNTLKWREPIVLRDQPNAGKTIIEKFEEYASDVDCVFVLLTPDDIAITDGTNDQKRRSRQNVIFEMGFFCGAFGRRSGRVILLYKGTIELPSDLAGVIWIDITGGVKGAGEEIRKEIAAWSHAPATLGI
jgi:predicted nucleotide-binding protein